MSTAAYAAGGISGAATGALAGATLGPIGAGVGAGIGLLGGLLGASAQDSSSDAYQQMAQAQLEAQQQNRNLAMGFAAPTMDELQNQEQMYSNMQRLYSYQLASHQRDSQILESQYPGIVAAAKNMYNLQTGKEAPILAPLRQQQQYDRQKLQNQLQTQLGSGWETSSAGIEAMTRFDQNSQMSLQQAQLQAMGAVSSASNALTGDYQSVNGNQNRDALSIGELGNYYGSNLNSIQSRQISAANQTSITPYAGANNVAQYLNGQYGATTYKNILGTGAGAVTAYGVNKNFGGGSGASMSDYSLPKGSAPAGNPNAGAAWSLGGNYDYYK